MKKTLLTITTAIALNATTATADFGIIESVKPIQYKLPSEKNRGGSLQYYFLEDNKKVIVTLYNFKSCRDSRNAQIYTRKYELYKFLNRFLAIELNNRTILHKADLEQIFKNLNFKELEKIHKIEFDKRGNINYIHYRD